jgi:hypothetical protein
MYFSHVKRHISILYVGCRKFPTNRFLENFYLLVKFSKVTINTLNACLGNTIFFFFIIIFQIHVSIVLLNLNSTQVLFNFFQFCLKFFKSSKYNFKKQIYLVFTILNIIKNSII